MNTFLASVGIAQLLVRKNGKLVHLADCKTLTESSLSFANSMEEIRAGSGAKLYGRFAHSSGMEIKLVDAMFDQSYMKAVLGAYNGSNSGGTAIYLDKDYSVSEEGVLSFSREPKNMGTVCGLTSAPVWISHYDDACEGDREWTMILPNAQRQYLVPEEFRGKTLCVKYFALRPEAASLLVPATFAPEECALILTASLYAGDANAPAEGKPIGEITIKIPRFQLNGSLDIQSAMNVHAPMELSGIALADSTMTCPTDAGDIYCEVISLRCDWEWYHGLEDIIYDKETENIYGIYKNGSVSQLTDDLEGVSEYYNDETKVLYSVEVPGTNTMIQVNPSPDLIYTGDNLDSVGDNTGFSYGVVSVKPEAISIAPSAFRRNTNIEVVYLPDGISTMGKEGTASSNIFDGCANLTRVNIPNTLTVLEIYSFRDCVSLTSVVVNVENSRLKQIRGHAFENCSNLPFLPIPDGVTSIGASAFCYCTSLTSMTIPKTVRNFGGVSNPSNQGEAFAYCSALSSVVFAPDSELAFISRSTFAQCRFLTSVVIPDSVTAIYDYAFASCPSLKSAVVGEGAKQISRGAFNGCSSLKSITVLPQTPPSLGAAVFGNTDPNLVIYVRAQAVNDYKAASGWSSYASRIQAIPT